MLDVQKPIIVVGAGRSGSTLISRMLDQHEEIRFCVDNYFLVPRLWLEFWEDRFWFNAKLFVESNPTSALASYPDVKESDLLEEMNRVGRVIAGTLIALLDIDVGRWNAWGYKEIWNGSAQFHYDWMPYDTVFPRAIWVHLIRNPFDFSRSCANWNRDPFTLDYLHKRLKDWTSIVECSRTRKSTGRYFEIRYEDAVKDPESVLTPVLDQVGLPWAEACGDARSTYQLKSRGNEDGESSDHCHREEIEACVANIVGLKDLIDELGYNMPKDFQRQVVRTTSGQERSSFERLNLLSQTSPLKQGHKPQHVLWHQLGIMEAECARLQEQRDQFRRERDYLFNESLLKMLRRKLALRQRFGPLWKGVRQR